MEELKPFDTGNQTPMRSSEERLRQIFEQSEPCETETVRFIILDKEDRVELFITFKDADGKRKAHTIRFDVEPAYLWASFTTDYRLKMIQAHSEFTSRMVAESVDEYVKRVRRATLSEVRAEEGRPAFNETLYRCNEFVQLSPRNIEGD